MVVIMNIMVLKNIAPNNKEKLLSKLEKGIIRILIKKIIPFVKKIITFLNIKFLNDEIGYLVNVMSNFIFDSKFCNLESKLEAFWFKTLKKKILNVLYSNSFMRKCKFAHSFLNVFNVQVKNVNSRINKKKKQKKIK